MIQRRSIFGLLASVLSAGILFCAFIYFKDTGTPYTGRARFYYNMDYLFATSPKCEMPVDSKYYTFTYLTNCGSQPARVSDMADHGYMFANYLEADWEMNTPRAVRDELHSFLTGSADWHPSDTFKLWLISERHNISKTERILLKDGTPAALITVTAVKPGFAGNYRYLIAEHGELLIKFTNIASSAIPQAEFLRMRNEGMMLYSLRGQIRPDAARDMQSYRTFTRLLETFAFK